MAHSTSSLPSVTRPNPAQNINSSGTAEQRGSYMFGEVDVTSYTSGGEVINAAEMGLNKVYGAVFFASESDTYAARSFEVAAGNKSGTLNVDTAGTGTEVTSTTDIGKFVFIAWGEALGSGTN
jgi:hypothetical protein